MSQSWFRRLDFIEPIPDHSISSNNLHGRFRDSFLYRKVPEDVVARRIAFAVVGGKNAEMDASLIRAEATKLESTAKGDQYPKTINPEIAWRAVLASEEEVEFPSALAV
ncbi:MAG: hypothetical protein AAF160_21285 [Pseudomonadota bacterium]